ncbi:MAG: tRNA lysidine(34) synthetase TilS [Candidatus Omnitrophica bacterium]|nr:tRNA lysidine(34) synthetase TilS [Candidatus Omnitrophota bacterium]
MILKKVEETIRHYNLIQKKDKVLVAVSGGPDSVALLYILNSLKKKLGISLHVAHLDHMLRKDSWKDKEFVESLAKRLALPISSAQINVKEFFKSGSLEEIARNIRLGFLFKIAKEVKAKKIALGHNLDDQVETVLMRILRGAGLYGLRGILPKREICGFTIIRPLINLSRKEIEGYLKRRKIKPLIDYTNLEDIYLRNRIRHRLIPLLEKEYNPNIKEVLANMVESIGRDYDYLLNLAEDLYLKEAKLKNEDRIEFNLNRFLKLHPSLQRIFLRLAFLKFKGDLRRFEFRHIKEIEELLYCRPVNSIVDLPKGVSVIKKKRTFYLYKRK